MSEIERGVITMKISNINTNPINQINLKNTKQETENFKKVLENAKQSNDKENLATTCKQFESIFVNILMNNMRRTVVEGGLVEKSQAREMFESMLDEEIAKEVSKEQGIGLAQTMYDQLSKNMEIEE